MYCEPVIFQLKTYISTIIHGQHQIKLNIYMCKYKKYFGMVLEKSKTIQTVYMKTKRVDIEISISLLIYKLFIEIFHH